MAKGSVNLTDKQVLNLLIHYRVDPEVTLKDLTIVAKYLHGATVTERFFSEANRGLRRTHLQDQIENIVRAGVQRE